MSGFFNSRNKQADKSDDSDLTPQAEGSGVPDTDDDAARFLDETYHLADHPLADAKSAEQSGSPSDSAPRQRRRKQSGPRRFGVQLPDTGNKSLPLKRAAVPIEDILARRGRQSGYTAGPGGPSVKLIADPYGHGQGQGSINSGASMAAGFDDDGFDNDNANAFLDDPGASPGQASGSVSITEPSLAQLREAVPANDPSVPAPAVPADDNSLDFLDELDQTQKRERTGDQFDLTRPGTTSGGSVNGPLQSPEAEYAASRKRRRLAGVALLLLATGLLMSVLAYLGGPSTIVEKITGTTPDADESLAVESPADSASGNSQNASESVFVRVDPQAGLELRKRRDDALSTIGGLIASGELQQAQKQLDDLDLVVYGYGQQEFDGLLERIEDARNANVQESSESTGDSEQVSIVDRQTGQSGEQGQPAQIEALTASDAQSDAELQAQINAELQNFSAETARLREEARLIAQETRLAREQAGQEREQQQAELARVLSEQREAELARVQQIEQQRELAEAARVEEEQRLQQVRQQLQLEQERAEAALREIEQRRIAEETRLAEAAAELEQQRLAQRQALEEAAKAAEAIEAKRLAELQRQQDAQLLAEQQAEEEAARLESERLAAEQLRVAQEQVEAERAAELQRQQEAQLLARQKAVEQERLQQERQQAEQALADEQARLADLQRQEAELLAQQRAEQQERLRQERLAAEQAQAERLAELERQEEEQLLARQQAEEEERQRIERLEEQQLQAEREAEIQRQEEARAAEALEQRRKLELAARLAQQRRQEAAELRVAEAARLADERRAQQRLANAEQQRREREAELARQAEEEANEARAAEQVRLERQAAIARQRERLRANAAEQQRRANQLETQDSDAELVAVEPEPVRNQPISDVDIARVYRQFQALEQAIEAKDMDRVLTITEQSGSQVGLFLQLFQNFDELDVRIENVSSQPSTGVIQGKLRLRTVVRNGVRSAPPAVYPATTAISSRRNSNGEWSKIVW